MKIKGIYCIQNTINGKRYIGSSNNIKERFAQHKNELNKNKHTNSLLQRAWNKYGSESFIFSIIEDVGDRLTRKELLGLEAYYIDFYKSYKCDNGYNIGNPFETGITECNRNFYDNFFKNNKKISRKQFDEIIFYLCNTHLTNKEISELTGVSNRNVVAIYEKQNFYELTKDLTFIKRSGAHPKINEEIVTKIVDLLLDGCSATEINNRLNLSLSYSTISDIRNHRTWCSFTEGIIFPKYKHDKGPKKPVKQLDKNGNIITTYSSAREASKITGINYKDISAACLKKIKSAGGYCWSFLN